jgi:uncharacterized protein YceK
MKVVPLTLTASLLLGACSGSSSPLAPTPGLPGGVVRAGEWSGRTSQQQPISFTVSSDRQVTAFSVGYVFSGCSGVESLSGRSHAATFPVTQFGLSLPDGRGMMVTIVFLPDGAVSGGVVFYGPPSCGSTGTAVQFNASRH